MTVLPSCFATSIAVFIINASASSGACLQINTSNCILSDIVSIQLFLLLTLDKNLNIEKFVIKAVVFLGFFNFKRFNENEP